MAPTRQHVRVGAFVILLLLPGAAACDRVAPGAGPRVLELAHDTIRLEAGVTLVEVTVQRAAQEFEPAAVVARPGDVVRFTAADNGGHAIVFGSSAAPDVLAFLQQSGQLRSPPLIASGSAWVISLADAPTGEYPFRCVTHDAAGRLTVSAR